VLEEALRSAMLGEGRAVFLAGEAGLGKSRLCRELTLRAETLDCVVLRGACSDGELSLPYLPFVDAISSYLVGVDKAWLRDQLGESRRELAQLFTQLESEAAPEIDDPVRAKLRLFEAITALFQVAAGSHGLSLVIEDIHWADASTRELLDYIVRRLPRAGWLLVATYRSDEIHRKHPLQPMLDAWQRGRLVETLELKPLAREDVADMVKAIFDKPDVTREFRDFFAARSEGNPFVIEEMLKQQVEEGTIRRDDEGRWERDSLADLRLPRTVSDSILIRLERLDGDEAEVLRAASVLGSSFSYDALVDLTEQAPALVQKALHSGVQQQMIQADEHFGSRYRWRHALTKEAIYTDMIEPQRKELHMRAAGVLRAQPGTAPVELAGHLLAADQWEEALPLCMEAAADAVRRRGYREAAELYERMLPHLSDKLEHGRVLSQLGEATWRAGDPSSALRFLEKGIAILDGAAEKLVAAHHRMTLARCYWETSQLARAHETYEAGRVVLAAAGPSEDLAVACCGLAGLYAFELKGAQSQQMAEQAVAIAGEVGAYSPLIRAYNFLGIALVFQGRVTEGIEFMDRSYTEALTRDYDWNALTALYNSVVIRLWHLRAVECPPLVERLRRLPDGWWRDLAYGRARAMMSQRLCDLEAALESARSVKALAEEGGASTFVAWARRQEALILSEMGTPEEALSVLPPQRGGDDRQELFFDYEARMRAHLSLGQTADAAAVADLVRDAGEWAQDAIVIDAACEAYAAAARLEDGRSLLAAGIEDGIDPTSPYFQVSAARFDLLERKPELALKNAEAAAARFGKAEYRLDEMRARLVAARALLALGRRDEAAAALSAIVDVARSRHARQVVVEVTHEADRAGIELAEAEITPASAVPTASISGDRISIVAELRQAIRQGEFVLHYQPKRNLATGEIDWAEALIRWQNPRRGMVSPDQFIPIAEQLGLIRSLTMWVVDSAVTQLRKWIHQGRFMGVSVNMSVWDLDEPRFTETVARALEASNVPPSRLILEITESGAMQKPEVAMDTMRQLRALGVSLSIDDFGTGHSSLSYLRQLPVSELKIDKSFCMEMDQKNLVIIRSAIRMGHDLGLKVTAEGVEQPESLQLLSAMACDYAQGYLIGRPMPAADLEQMVPVTLEPAKTLRSAPGT
jgi:EAL domain-containing protein (putative c-di-GMP-specific phosphodiesterase class I)